MFFAKTYYLNFSSLRSEEAIERYMNVITPDRQNRIQTTKRTETKASLLGAGLLLKAVLKKEYDLDADIIKCLSKDQTGLNWVGFTVTGNKTSLHQGVYKIAP